MRRPLPAADRAGSMSFLNVNDVGYAIDGRFLVRDVTLSVDEGQRVAFVGPNGAGKSTLVRVLAGIRAPTTGTVRLAGDVLHAMRHRERARRVAFVGQEEAPAADLLLREAVALGRTPHRRPWSGDSAAERLLVADALRTVGLADRAEDRCDHLSGGERRRLVLARGLVQQAGLLILDEPTNHLDIAWQLRLLAALDAFHGTVLAAIHDVDTVVRHFDLVVVLSAGRVVAVGEPEQTLTPKVVRACFGVETSPARSPATGQRHLLVDGVTDPVRP